MRMSSSWRGAALAAAIALAVAVLVDPSHAAKQEQVQLQGFPNITTTAQAIPVRGMVILHKAQGDGAVQLPSCNTNSTDQFATTQGTYSGKGGVQPFLATLGASELLQKAMIHPRAAAISRRATHEVPPAPDFGSGVSAAYVRTHTRVFASVVRC